MERKIVFGMKVVLAKTHFRPCSLTYTSRINRYHSKDFRSTENEFSRLIIGERQPLHRIVYSKEASCNITNNLRRIFSGLNNQVAISVEGRISEFIAVPKTGQSSFGKKIRNLIPRTIFFGCLAGKKQKHF